MRCSKISFDASQYLLMFYNIFWCSIISFDVLWGCPKKVSKKAADVWCRHLKSPLVDWITINSLLHSLFYPKINNISSWPYFLAWTIFCFSHHALFHIWTITQHHDTQQKGTQIGFICILRIGKGVPNPDTIMKWNILYSNKRQKQELKKQWFWTWEKLVAIAWTWSDLVC